MMQGIITCIFFRNPVMSLDPKCIHNIKSTINAAKKYQVSTAITKGDLLVKQMRQKSGNTKNVILLEDQYIS